MNRAIVVLATILLLASLDVEASPFSQRKGYFQNDKGQQCWYVQRVEAESKYFHGSIKGQRGIITFDNPRCMRDSGLGLAINKMLINNVVTRWHSHADAAFQTRVEDLYPSSMMQKRGYCIQSKKYPQIGVTIDYVVQGDSITQVFHGGSFQGCTK